MEGPFVPTFTEIGKLTQKVPLGWAWTPRWGGDGGRIKILAMLVDSYKVRTICAKFHKNRSISWKSPPLGDMDPPPWRARWRKFEKLKKLSRGNASGNMYAKFCDDRTIFRHLKIGGTEKVGHTDIHTDIQTYIQNFFYCCFGVVGG